ncbi:MAG TPA: hypothetical protein PK604_00670 [Acetivibrio clariflavus]|nr:hypothetical protein [Acetivibrio clariflavus]
MKKRNNSVILAYDCRNFIYNIEGSGYINLSDLKEYGISAVVVDGDLDGVNSELLEKIHRHGLQIILNLDTLNRTNDYYRELEYAVKKYDIRYLLIYNSKEEKLNTDQDVSIGKLAELIERNSIIFLLWRTGNRQGI